MLTKHTRDKNQLQTAQDEICSYRSRTKFSRTKVFLLLIIEAEEELEKSSKEPASRSFTIQSEAENCS